MYREIYSERDRDRDRDRDRNGDRDRGRENKRGEILSSLCKPRKLL